MQEYYLQVVVRYETCDNVNTALIVKQEELAKALCRYEILSIIKLS